MYSQAYYKAWETLEAKSLLHTSNYMIDGQVLVHLDILFHFSMWYRVTFFLFLFVPT
jgi:hypothetical protein